MSLLGWLYAHAPKNTICSTFLRKIAAQQTATHLFEDNGQLVFAYKVREIAKMYPDVDIISIERGWKHAGMYVISRRDEYGWKTWGWHETIPRRAESQHQLGLHTRRPSHDQGHASLVMLDHAHASTHRRPNTYRRYRVGTQSRRVEIHTNRHDGQRSSDYIQHDQGHASLVMTGTTGM